MRETKAGDRSVDVRRLEDLSGRVGLLWRCIGINEHKLDQDAKGLAWKYCRILFDLVLKLHG
jgi:hypothetical protein